MSSRDIARLFYLNKVLIYIIYLCFWRFYFVSFICSIYIKCWSKKFPRNLIDSSLCISYLLIISFGMRRGISSFLLGLWKNKYFVFPTFKESLLQWTNLWCLLAPYLQHKEVFNVLMIKEKISIIGKHNWI